MTTEKNIRFTPKRRPYVLIDSVRYYLDLEDIFACIISFVNGEKFCLLFDNEANDVYVELYPGTYLRLVESMAAIYKEKISEMIRIYLKYKSVKEMCEVTRVK